ncbi:MAG: hypothetical protein M3290_13985, partial [Actinomycetota bacterium]|nr:hypothetical protein [Actinomycetota bacterium]
MTEPERLWRDFVAEGRPRLLSDLGRDVVEPVLQTARAAGALVLVDSFDPVAAGVGLGPLPRLVSEVLAEFEMESTPPRAQWWVGPALDDLLGRSDLHRDVSEIYSAIALVLRLAASDRAVAVVLEGIEWASDAARNLLPYLVETLDAPVLVVTTTGEHARESTSEAHLEIADELAAGARSKTEPEL